MKFDMHDHLRERHFYPGKYSGVSVTETEMSTLLWNLSGEVVGYHVYRPHGDKKSKVNEEKKYFTHVTKGKSAVWGLETLDWSRPYLFITEGIFDAARLHYHGLAAIAVLGNNPQHLGNWLKTLQYTAIAAVQGDKAGLMLALTTNSAIFLPEGNDVDDLPEEKFLELFSKYFDPEPLV